MSLQAGKNSENEHHVQENVGKRKYGGMTKKF